MPNSIQNLVSQARQRLQQELQSQAAQLQKVEESLQELRGKLQQLESAVEDQLEALGKAEPGASAGGAVADASLETVLGGVRNLITATLPEQVLEVLTEEAEQLGVRAAVFDVRGKAAWGSSARGFGSRLSDKAFRGVVVSLTQDNPFRQCFETAGSVDATKESLAKNKNVVDKLGVKSGDSIILLPIRSAGSVSAIFYADSGGKGTLAIDALKILAEFGGAQLDRLIALSGGLPSQVAEAEAAPVEEVGEVEAEPEPSVQEVEAVPAVEEYAPVAEEAAAPQVEDAVQAAEAPVAAPAAKEIDLSQLGEADQKVHRDAKRFARLLVSEIELYNKAKVADGRKNKDLYSRLKTDIERSRQTYEKRFGKTVAKEQPYFHEELVKTLAANDVANLGSDYPGPSA